MRDTTTPGDRRAGRIAVPAMLFAHTTMRILIAEDDSILADGLIRSLRQSGYAVDHVRHGVDA
ncbi:MAG: two-component system, OmpR family, response regulator, partial [Caballeronia sp.]|nr:two-component system, OmpR family, response regulator [Caballeronia sp.]